MRALLARRPVTAAPRGTIGRVRLAARRNPIAALATAITALALVATTGVSIYAAIYARTAAIEASAVAEQTGAVYDAFLDTFLPQQLDPKSMRDLTVREYFRTRIEELERVATRPLGENSAKGCIETARMLQYSCISLDLLEEAERCNLLLQACSKRLSLKGKFSGMGVKETDLDAIYIRLARNPNDAPALAELRSLTPKFLEQNRIVRWTSLSRLGAVTYLHSVPLATAVASNLLDLRADDPDVSVSACALIALAMHSESAAASSMDVMEVPTVGPVDLWVQRWVGFVPPAVGVSRKEIIDLISKDTKVSPWEVRLRLTELGLTEKDRRDKRIFEMKNSFGCLQAVGKRAIPFDSVM